MLRRDFMERQFEEFAKFLAAIMGLRREKQWEAADQQINALLATAMGEKGGDPEEPFDQFLANLDQGKTLGADHWTLLGNILLEKYRNMLDIGQSTPEQIQKVGAKALHVLLMGILQDQAIFRMAEVVNVQSLVANGIQPETQTQPMWMAFQQQYMR